ncbi:MAG: hypothetical protein ACLFV7_05505 [Phycisphaerae bacterium]
MARRLTQADSELFIEYALRMTKGRIRLISVATAVLTVVAAGVAMLLLMIAADHFTPGGLSPAAATAFRVAFMLVELALIAMLVAMPLAQRINDLYVARLIEKSHPDFRNDLTSALQLAGDGHVGKGTLAAIKRRAAGEVAETDVESSVTTRGIRLTGIICCVSILVFGLYCVTSDKAIWPSVQRVALGNTHVAAPTITHITDFQPHTGQDVLTGRPVEFTATVAQRKGAPVQVRVYRDGKSSLLDDDLLVMEPTGENSRGEETFVATWPSATATGGNLVRFEILCGDARTGGMLQVLQAPTVADLQTTLHWPEYTGKGSETLNKGTIEALPGTKVIVSAKANHAVQLARLRFEKANGLLMKAADRRMQAQFTVTDDDRYRIAYKGTHPLVDYDEDSWYEIRMLTDHPPEVKVTEPEHRVELALNEVLRVGGEASDDYGLASMTLVARVPGEDQPRRFPLGRYTRPGAATRTISHAEPVENLGKEGQLVTLHVEAADYRTPGGGQVTRSQPFQVFIKPPDEQIIAQQQAEREARENQQQQNDDPADRDDDPDEGNDPADENDPRQDDGGEDDQLAQRDDGDDPLDQDDPEMDDLLDPDDEKEKEQLDKLRDELDPQKGADQAGQDQQGQDQQGQGQQGQGQQGEGQGQGAGGQGPAGGPHSGNPSGDPNSGSQDERGEVDDAEVDKLTPAEKAKLESLGRALDEAQKQLRDGEVDPELLKKFGMTEKEFKDFVKKYAGKYGKVRDMLEQTERTNETDRLVVRGGSGDTQEGTGTADDATGASGREDLSPDEIKKLYESRKGNVSPEYRKQVEDYFRAISEGLGDDSDTAEDS